MTEQTTFRRRAERRGLRLWHVWIVLPLAFATAVTVAATVFYTGWDLLEARGLKPEHRIDSQTLFDLVKLSFGVVAGAGALVALIVAYRRQRVDEDGALREATRLHTERFTTAVSQLGNDSAAVRLGGVHALAGLADDAPTRDLRQTCIDVLCAYLRLPYTAEADLPARDPEARHTYLSLREVRHTVLRLIRDHLRLNPRDPHSWRGHHFDFTAVIFDGGDFSEAVFSGGTVSFNGAVFSGGTVSFNGAVFSGGKVDFGSARFSGGAVSFRRTVFSGGTVSFRDAVFSESPVDFGRAQFSGGTVDFGGAGFAGRKVDFEGARFSGSTVSFGDTKFSGGTVSFHDAGYFDGAVYFGRVRFSGGTVDFGGAGFAGGTVDFEGARFSGSTVDFRGARFSGSTVSFGNAAFSGGTVDLTQATGTAPSGLPLPNGSPVPTGLLLPSTWTS
ncbi:pentapeptide repeat-containing protein [Streptomyces sp. MI02-2A]|uniref:pentapeptide repeat-containing protein n=1 Tax=Streptomyces sp. MI02-2A TaxID=3028688 RepID=UPI0029A03C1C|nr:pentapeptide repeat-containing protein [Streptomyces sp. MI02-2A]MDX3265566.1 pentapeptide repeat-containing protein [Streptomyces sp. MI02-2A]